jgi:hypothetical protein
MQRAGWLFPSAASQAETSIAKPATAKRRLNNLWPRLAE